MATNSSQAASSASPTRSIKLGLVSGTRCMPESSPQEHTRPDEIPYSASRGPPRHCHARRENLENRRPGGNSQPASPEGTTVSGRGRQPTDSYERLSNESPEGAAQESPGVGLRPRLLTAVASRLTAKAPEHCPVEQNQHPPFEDSLKRF